MRQYIFLITALLIATFFVLFALQNSDTVNIDLLFVQFQSSLALVLLFTLAAGIIIGLLFSAYNIVKKTMKISQQNKQIKELENVIHSQEVSNLQISPQQTTSSLGDTATHDQP